MPVDRPSARGPEADTDLIVRPAVQADVGAMLDIYRPIVEETAISFELSPPTEAELADRLAARSAAGDPWLVATLGTDVVGYTYASPFRSRPAYGYTRETTVYVHPSAHGRGVGTGLLTTLLGELAVAGVRQAIAGIVPPNPESVGLHERLGYVYVGTFPAVGYKFERWHDLGFWQRPLTLVGS